VKGNIREMPENKAGETMIAGVLRRMAKDRAESLKWNSQIAMMFYALLVTVALLELRDANIFLVSALAAVGLLALWTVSRVHWKRSEQRLYREELDNYHRIVSAEPETQTAEPEPWEEPLLTKRELEVLTRVADGRSNKEIDREEPPLAHSHETRRSRSNFGGASGHLVRLDPEPAPAGITSRHRAVPFGTAISPVR
jgi:hypothetical protein